MIGELWSCVICLQKVLVNKCCTVTKVPTWLTSMHLDQIHFAVSWYQLCTISRVVLTSKFSTEKWLLFCYQPKDVPCHDYFYSLKNVSFCAFHPRDHRYLGFITKHPQLQRFACHVFMGTESTRPVAEAVGWAFSLQDLMWPPENTTCQWQ